VRLESQPAAPPDSPSTVWWLERRQSSLARIPELEPNHVLTTDEAAAYSRLVVVNSRPPGALTVALLTVSIGRSAAASRDPSGIC